MAVGLARATRRLRRTDQHLVAHRQRRSAHGAPVAPVARAGGGRFWAG